MAVYQSLTGNKDLSSDPVPVNALCAALAHAAQWSRALHLLGSSCDPWRHNAVLTACGRASHWALTLHLLSDMKLRRLADATSLNAAVHACQQAAHWQGALQLCSHAPGSLPSVSAALSACAAVAAWYQALALFEEMLSGSSGFPLPGPVGASAVLTALGRSTRWAQALGIFEAFAATTAPSISCFGAVAAACEVGEAWQPALRLLSQLPPLLPDAALMNAILGACGKGSQWQLSLCLLRHSNDTTGRGALLEALATAAKWVTALALLQEGPVDVVGAFAAASAFESAQEPACLLRAKQLRSFAGSKAPSLRKLLGELSGPHLGRRHRFSALSSLLRLESAVARKLLETRGIRDSAAAAPTRCRGHSHLLFLPVQPFRQFLTVCLQCELKGAEWVVHLDG